MWPYNIYVIFIKLFVVSALNDMLINDPFLRFCVNGPFIKFLAIFWYRKTGQS